VAAGRPQRKLGEPHDRGVGIDRARIERRRAECRFRLAHGGVLPEFLLRYAAFLL
jgi:hypothetical protein